jgi:hypothetical protein
MIASYVSCLTSAIVENKNYASSAFVALFGVAGLASLLQRDSVAKLMKSPTIPARPGRSGVCLPQLLQEQLEAPPGQRAIYRLGVHVAGRAN